MSTSHIHTFEVSNIEYFSNVIEQQAMHQFGKDFFVLVRKLENNLPKIRQLNLLDQPSNLNFRDYFNKIKLKLL
jgi:hypothetical protein